MIVEFIKHNATRGSITRCYQRFIKPHDRGSMITSRELDTHCVNVHMICIMQIANLFIYFNSLNDFLSCLFILSEIINLSDLTQSSEY